MSGSRIHRQTRDHESSSANSHEKFSSSRQECLSFGAEQPLSGSFDDASLIRGVLIQSIKKSGKSRVAIAEEMEYLLARTVTEKMLNAFTAESRDDRRWPAEFDRAFCKATGDSTLLACRAQLAGLHVITEEDKLLMDLGRAHLIRCQAEEQIAVLQRRLHGRVA
jgi:hypothetical protein